MAHDHGGGSEGPQQPWDGLWYESGPEQPTERKGSAAVVALIVVLTVLALALIGAVGYLFLRPGGIAGERTLQQETSSSSSPLTTQAPVTETEYTTAPERETVTVTREAPPSTPQRVGSYPAGADSSGWIDNRQARCNAGDPAAMIGRTNQASFSICTNPDNGRYYYRGSSGGAGVEIDDPLVTRTYASVTNNNVLYWIDSSSMKIYEDGDLISEQPMVVLWAG